MKPSSAARPQVASEKLDDPLLLCTRSPERLEGLPPAVRQVAELFDGRRPLGEVVDRAQISEPKCLAVIKKLTAIGILEPSGAAPCPAPAFSEAEEAFFAAEIGPIDECDEPFSSVGDRVRAAVCELMTRLRSPQILG